MNLIEIPFQSLAELRVLPFDLYDSIGRLLARSGLTLSDSRLTDLHGQVLYADDTQYREWKRSLNRRIVEILHIDDSQLAELISAPQLPSRNSVPVGHHDPSSLSVPEQMDVCFEEIKLFLASSYAGVDSIAYGSWRTAQLVRSTLANPSDVLLFLSNFFVHCQYRSASASSVLLTCKIAYDLMSEIDEFSECDEVQSCLFYYVLYASKFAVNESSRQLDKGSPSPYAVFEKYLMPAMGDQENFSHVRLLRLFGAIEQVLVAIEKFFLERQTSGAPGCLAFNIFRYISCIGNDKSLILSSFSKLRTKFGLFLPGDLVFLSGGRVGALVRHTNGFARGVRLFDSAGLPLSEFRLDEIRLPAGHGVRRARKLQLKAVFNLAEVVACGFD